MNNPTRTQTTTTALPVNGNAIETVEEFASLNSVNVKQTAKGDWYVEVCKQYGQDLGEICDQAGEMAERALNSLKAKNLPTVGS